MAIMVGIEPNPKRLIAALAAIAACSTACADAMATVGTAVAECAEKLAAISSEIDAEAARTGADDT